MAFWTQRNWNSLPKSGILEQYPHHFLLEHILTKNSTSRKEYMSIKAMLVGMSMEPLMLPYYLELVRQ